MGVYEARPNPTVLYILVIAGIVIAGSVGYVLVAGVTSGPTPPSGGSGSGCPTGDACVYIPQGAGNGPGPNHNFNPEHITVVVGKNNTVFWIDQDSSACHTITSTSVPAGAKPFNDGNICNGQTYSLTLTVPGVYDYICTIHPWMVGDTITVIGPNGSAGAVSNSTSTAVAQSNTTG
jgi:plastocyanin